MRKKYIRVYTELRGFNYCYYYLLHEKIGSLLKYPANFLLLTPYSLFVTNPFPLATYHYLPVF